MSAFSAPVQQKPLRIGFVLAKDFTMSAFALFIDTLRLAGDEGDRSGKVHCDWDVLSATQRLVRSSTGIEVAPTAELGDPTRFSHIAVVGGLLRDPEPLDRASEEFLRSASKAHVPLIGICTGAFVLARIGLMKGRKACVSWFHYHDFKESFPDIGVMADRLFFVDGNRITCSGGAGAADLAAYLVERWLGAPAKQKALQVLQIERARSPSEPQPRSPLETPVKDDRVRRALLLMEQHMASPLRISAIAGKCGITPRALERLFLASLNARPNDVYVRLRLEAARDLVATTRESLIEIALSTGFRQPSNFSRRFKNAYGVPPSVFRQLRTTGQSKTCSS